MNDTQTTIKTEKYEVTTDNPRMAVMIIKSLLMSEVMGDSEESQPVATLGAEEYTPRDLVECWTRKASDSRRAPDSRAAYCDAAEKLETVLDNGFLTESP